MLLESALANLQWNVNVPAHQILAVASNCNEQHISASDVMHLELNT